MKRPSGQWEIRESVRTPAGPRARTLATFTVLSDEALDRASARATNPFDADQVRAAAWRSGAPVAETAADRAARALLAEAAAGHVPAPALRRLLVDRLTDGGLPPELASGDGAAEWAGASLDERGRALWDLLELTDHLPVRRRGPLRFPRLPVPCDG